MVYATGTVSKKTELEGFLKYMYVQKSNQTLPHDNYTRDTFKNAAYNYGPTLDDFFKIPTAASGIKNVLFLSYLRRILKLELTVLEDAEFNKDELKAIVIPAVKDKILPRLDKIIDEVILDDNYKDDDKFKKIWNIDNIKTLVATDSAN